MSLTGYCWLVPVYSKLSTVPDRTTVIYSCHRNYGLNIGYNIE